MYMSNALTYNAYLVAAGNLSDDDDDDDDN